MKKLFTILFSLSFLISSYAQVSWCDDFEGYNDGDPIAQTSNIWTTWGASSTPGLNPPYGDDANIVTTSANSGTNSLYFFSAPGGVGGPQDIVLPFGGQVINLGEFDLTMNMYVTSGAYFNFQSEVQAGIEWAMDCNLDSSGTMVFSTGGGATTFLTTNYPTNTWFELKINIDLTNNIWEVMIDSVSQGTFSNPINQIASLDLFPLGGHEFWVDDVCFSLTPYSPSPLNGAVTGIATIEGLAGQSKFPSVDVRNLGLNDITSFDLTVDYNGSQITENITGINLVSLASTNIVFTQPIILTGGNQSLTATISNVNTTAIDDNPSDDSNTISVYAVTPANGKLVIGEEGTGTWCGFCPRGTVAMEFMDYDYPGYFQGIAVHNGDPMTVTDYDNSLGNYISGYPSALVDRGADIDPSNFKIDFLQRITVSPSATMINGAELNGNNLNVSIDLDVSQTITSNWAIACVLIEDSVTGLGTGFSQSNYYSGGGQGPLVGLDGTDWTTLPGTVPFTLMHYDHVARAISPGWNGETIGTTLNAGESHNACFNFTIDPSWNIQKMKIIGMLINDNGRIDNGSSFSVNQAINNGYSCSTSSIQDNILFNNPSKILLYPNPTSSNTELALNLNEETYVRVVIKDITGKIVFEENYKQLNGFHTLSLKTNNLSSGIYSVEIKLNDKLEMMKLSVN